MAGQRDEGVLQVGAAQVEFDHAVAIRARQREDERNLIEIFHANRNRTSVTCPARERADAVQLACPSGRQRSARHQVDSGRRARPLVA